MEIMDFIIVVVCGFGIGVLSGMFGIGGGGMIVPLLHMAFGLPMIAATSTSLLTIAPTGISGSIKHLRQKTASLKTGLTIGGFGAIASVIGSIIADNMPDAAIVILTVIVILFSVGMMIRTLLKDKNLGKSPSQGESEELSEYRKDAQKAEKAQGVEGALEADYAESAQASSEKSLLKKGLFQELDLKSLALPMVIGLIAGGIAGIVGVGGGFIIVPFCVAYMGYSLKQAAGTSLVSISVIAIPGIVSHAILGHIWWIYGLAIMIGTIPGAQIGAWLIAKLPERPMRFAFAGLLALIGTMMLLQEFFL